MESGTGPGLIEGLSRNILETRFEQIDPVTLDNARLRLLDTLGGALGGPTLPDIAGLVRLVQDWGGAPQASILGYGTRVPVQHAALVNCTMCRAFDRGPLAYVFKGKIVPNHISETTVLTALALAEFRRVDGRELIAAMVLGDDLAARLHLAKDHPLPGEFNARETSAPPRPFESGVQTTAFGAAAIAGRLLGLSLRQMQNALGLVGNSDCFAGGIWDGAPTFKIGQGTAAFVGIVAAQLAQVGWNGLLDPLFDPRGGFFRRGCDHPELLSEGLGQKFFVEGLFKPYPGGGPTQAPTAAAILLHTHYNLKAEDIEEAVLRTSPGVNTGLHYARPYKVGDYPTGDALFSYKYAVANGLARGSATNRDYTAESVRDPAVQALIGRTRLALAELPRSEGVELEVRLKDGRRLSQYVLQPQGTPDKPLPRETLLGKFREQANFGGMLQPAAVEQLIQLLERPEEMRDVRDLVRLAVRE